MDIDEVSITVTPLAAARYACFPSLDTASGETFRRLPELEVNDIGDPLRTAEPPGLAE